MSERRKFGAHEFSFEADTGFISLVLNGRLVSAEVTELIRLILETWSTRGTNEPWFMMADCRRATGMSNDARKVFAEGWPATVRPPASYTVVYGASFAIRVLVTLLDKATTFVALRDGAPAVGVLNVVDTEAEARAWLAEKKRSWRAPSTLR